MKEKKGFKMPHLLFLMLGLILFASILTYIVPAGNFAIDESGNIIGSQFEFLEANTPVSPWKAVLLILTGVQDSGLVIALVLVAGGGIAVILETGALDELISWTILKLQDKGVKVLVPVTFILIGLIGAFGGGDQMVAIVPIGLMISKKLKLDPMCALGVTFFPVSIGYATSGASPGLVVPQTLMDLSVYSGFGVRMIALAATLLIGCVYTTHYAMKVSKDPSKSAMRDLGWAPDKDDDELKVRVSKLSVRTIIISAIFFLQYAVIVYVVLGFGKGQEYIIAIQLIAGVACGCVSGMGQEKIGRAFAKGAESMGFVVFIISLAKTLSLVMSEGNIIHTIVYYATRPLSSLPLAFSAIGLSMIIAVINVFIPSASGKAAILFPIVKPITQALGLTPQLAVSSFQYGDGFTNIISPALGATVGSLEKADVPYDKWLKWSMPCIALMFLACMVLLFILVNLGWNG